MAFENTVGRVENEEEKGMYDNFDIVIPHFCLIEFSLEKHHSWVQAPTFSVPGWFFSPIGRRPVSLCHGLLSVVRACVRPSIGASMC